jgi:hypothetical protein
VIYEPLQLVCANWLMLCCSTSLKHADVCKSCDAHASPSAFTCGWTHLLDVEGLRCDFSVLEPVVLCACSVTWHIITCFRQRLAPVLTVVCIVASLWRSLQTSTRAHVLRSAEEWGTTAQVRTTNLIILHLLALDSSLCAYTRRPIP